MNEFGGPAFPAPHLGLEGMSLRDYYAGQALAGILANPAWNAISLGLVGIGERQQVEVAAALAHVYADAMISRRAAK